MTICGAALFRELACVYTVVCSACVQDESPDEKQHVERSAPLSSLEVRKGLPHTGASVACVLRAVACEAFPIAVPTAVGKLEFPLSQVRDWRLMQLHSALHGNVCQAHDGKPDELVSQFNERACMVRGRLRIPCGRGAVTLPAMLGVG